MTDRELLELAAKAAGYKVEPDRSPYGMVFSELRGTTPGNRYYQPWNPLDDDGDALRLAVRLRLEITVNADWSAVGLSDELEYQDELHGSDPYAATRRAIVRAAAAIAQSMNQETPGRKESK